MRLFDRYTKDPHGAIHSTSAMSVIITTTKCSWSRGWSSMPPGLPPSLLLGGTLMEAVQFGSSLLVWGVFLRTVLVWHQTWAVNSLSHMWGYRNYETDEGSRNNWFSRPAFQRRRLAQQPPRRSALRQARPPLVGAGYYLCDDPACWRSWVSPRMWPGRASSASGQRAAPDARNLREPIAARYAVVGSLASWCQIRRRRRTIAIALTRQ